MTSSEFIHASQNNYLIESFEKMDCSSVVHGKLWKSLLDYYFVGGMPEAVKENALHIESIFKYVPLYSASFSY